MPFLYKLAFPITKCLKVPRDIQIYSSILDIIHQNVSQKLRLILSECVTNDKKVNCVNKAAIKLTFPVVTELSSNSQKIISCLSLFDIKNEIKKQSQRMSTITKENQKNQRQHRTISKMRKGVKKSG